MSVGSGSMLFRVNATLTLPSILFPHYDLGNVASLVNKFVFVFRKKGKSLM